MKVEACVLLVDDEAYVRESLASLLERRGFEVRAAGSVAEALEPRTLDGVELVLTDLRMPGGDGLTLVERLAEDRPGLPVVVLTAHGTVGSAVECMRAGAADYVLKPADPNELVLVLRRALETSALRREVAFFRSGRDAAPQRRDPVGVSPAWRRVLELVDLAARAPTTVLLRGETGTGKEEVAGLLHRRSDRAGGPFVGVNCAAIPPDLFESEFFGHRRGAFTGAHADRDGRFRIAHRGTLFLDEIDALPPLAQAKVLRVLQDGTFERVGDSRPSRVDVRLICATNCDLELAVQEGRFRADLYYRVNVLAIEIPPLRERLDDLPVLLDAFLAELGKRLGKGVPRVDDDVLSALEAYDWPGNVRELRNVIERALLVQRGESLSRSCLPAELRRAAGDSATSGSLRDRLLTAERRLLEQALEVAGGRRREAARQLGVDERNLAYYLRKHDLMDWGR